MKSVLLVAFGICSTIVAAFPNTTPALMRTSDSTDSPDNQTTTDTSGNYLFGATAGFEPLTNADSFDVPTSYGTCEDQKALEERNKELVLMAYQEIFGDYNIDDAVDRFFRSDYIQHNPDVPDGTQGLKDFAKVFTQGQEKKMVDIRRVSADGDLVWIHLKSHSPDGKDLAIIDIFRVEDGLIVEHWDVIQEIPDASASKNPHPFF